MDKKFIEFYLDRDSVENYYFVEKEIELIGRDCPV
jgi:hypothetical protein